MRIVGLLIYVAVSVLGLTIMVLVPMSIAAQWLVGAATLVIGVGCLTYCDLMRFHGPT